MAKIFISELKKGQTVESIFHVREKVLSKTKTGNPYLSLQRRPNRQRRGLARGW